MIGFRNFAIAQAHFIGAILSTLFAILIIGVTYDATAPVVSPAGERAADPSVEPGGVLTIIYPAAPSPRPCDTKNVRLEIIDARGLVQPIALTSFSLSMSDKGEGVLSIPVPEKASLGMARFNVSYDRVCDVLGGLWKSTHPVVRPPIHFLIEPHQSKAPA